MKHLITSDLHKILFGTTFESDPDNWDLRVSIARAFLSHHMVFFKPSHKIQGSQYWGTQNPEEHFYDVVCPGIILSLTEFEYVCENYMDLDLIEQKITIENVFDGVDNAIKKLRKLSEPQYAVSMIIEAPKNDIAA